MPIRKNKIEQLPKKPKRSLFDHLVNSVCVLILLFLLCSEYAHLRKPDAPMGEYTPLYEKHYALTLTPPFAFSYYLLVPENYDPAVKYPLVVALRGISNYVYAGSFLATPELRGRYPAFVVVPIVSKRSDWASPKDKSYALQRKGLRFPDALPQAVQAIRATQARYSIDPARIYVTGHSAGGIGAFGALARYPDLFAAGLISAGLWDPLEAPNLLKRPIWAVHGSADRQIPAEPTRILADAIKHRGGHIRYTELPGAGHGIWRAVYGNEAVWDWLFSQTRAPEGASPDGQLEKSAPILR